MDVAQSHDRSGEQRVEAQARSIPEHLSEVARRFPDAVAVAANDRTLTHAELDREAGRVASMLTRRLMSDECSSDGFRVAVLIEHNAANLVATLGILKTGAAVIPLDPAWADDRLEWTIATSEPTAIVTSATLARRANDVALDAPVVIVEDCRSENGWKDDVSIAPHSAAFVISTSGSSGTPKAVVDLHQNVLHEALRLGPALRLRPGDRQTVVRSNCAGSISDTFTALLAGATVLPFDAVAETHGSFLRWLAARRPTVWRSAPSLFRVLFSSSIDDALLADLRVVFLCGEPAFGSDLELFRTTTNERCVLVNCYGTTETATATTCIYDHRSIEVDGALGIGGPVAGIGVELVDPEGRVVVGPGAGQLVIRSEYLAERYLNDPERTSAAFITDADGSRRYVTGDLGERRLDGTLACLGRLGHRSDDYESAALRARQTPRPVLESKALSWNGKSAIDPVDTSISDTATEIAELWAQLLELAAVDPDGNFFELGGDSLLAIECSIVLEQRFGVETDPSVILEAPTARSLALRLHAGNTSTQGRALVPMRTSGEKPPLFLVHGWHGDVFGWEALSRALSTDRPIFGVQAVTNPDGSPAHGTVDAMVGQYVAEILSVHDGPYHLCGYSSGGRLAWAIAERLRAQAATVGVVALIETGRHVDLPWRGNVRSKIRHIARRARPPNPRLRVQELPDFYANALAHHPLGRLDCDVVVFFGQEAYEHILRSLWCQLTSGVVEFFELKGRHLQLLQSPRVELLSVELERSLVAAEAASTIG